MSQMILEEESFSAFQLNPAVTADSKWAFFIGTHGSFQTNLRYKDLITDEGDKKYFDEIKLLSKDFDQLIIRAGITQSFGGYYNIGNIGFSLGVNPRLEGYNTIPRALVELYAYGNEPFIGKTVEINPVLSNQLFLETALGIHLDLESVRVGLRYKRLHGGESIITDVNDLTLGTSDDIYQITVGGFGKVNYTDVDKISLTDGNNKGSAVDVGVKFSLNDRSEMAIAVRDIGSINYTNNTNNYRVGGNQSFDGFDLIKIIKADTTIEYQDTLEQLLGYNKLNEEFTAKLPLKTDIAYMHTIDGKSQAAIRYMLTAQPDRMYHDVSLMYRRSLLNSLALTGIYNFFSGNHAFGIGASYKYKGFHFAVMSGDIISIFDIKRTDFQNISLQLAYRVKNKSKIYPEL